MKILVTGAKGFVGSNLCAELKNCGYDDVVEYDLGSTAEELDEACRTSEFIFHLAGVNRPKEEKDFMEGNFGFTSDLLGLLKKHNNKSPVLITSSIQAALDNPYGKSKKAGENLIFEYGQDTGAEVYVYRLVNLFGKWSRPNYNSVVATFCHNIARNIDIQINSPDTEVELCYIDDVLKAFFNTLDGNPIKDGKFCVVPVTYQITVWDLAELIKSFKTSRDNLSVPNMLDPFTKKLYSTYLSYLPADSFSYPLKMNVDNRGSFTEFLRTPDRGQVSVNVAKPGITKGNHWHHTKNEKFLVVYGEGAIKFRNINLDEIIEYKVSGDKLEVVDIPPGYTHNIINSGDTDMVTIMWANELFDPDKPDSYYLEV